MLSTEYDLTFDCTDECGFRTVIHSGSLESCLRVASYVVRHRCWSETGDPNLADRPAPATAKYVELWCRDPNESGIAMRWLLRGGSHRLCEREEATRLRRQGLSFREIAERMGLELDTVKRIIREHLTRPYSVDAKSKADNVALVRLAYRVFEQGQIQGVLRTLSDLIEWETPQVKGQPFGGPRSGKAEVEEFLRLLRENEELLEFDIDEFIAEGSQVVVVGRYRGRVKTTGRILEMARAHVFIIKFGEITRFFELFDTAKAEWAYSKPQPMVM